MNQIINYLSKIIWAFINLIPIKPSLTPHITNTPKHPLLVLTLEYDKFKERSVKILKYGINYPCGQKTHTIIKNYCAKNFIPLIQIMTSDSVHELPTKLSLNEIQWIPNFGTDIAALECISELLANYEKIVVINSSANSNQAHLIKNVITELIDSGDRNVVIGVNANQRYSPTFPIISPRSPHIISNFFACNTSLLLTTMCHAKKSLLYRWLGGYSNKYVAIRLFELLLSRHALTFHGDLLWVRDKDIISYTKWPKKWPKNDSRVLKK